MNSRPHTLLLVFATLLSVASAAVAATDAPSPPRLHPKPFSQLQEEGRALVVNMFDRALSMYLEHAFPKDELLPLTCAGVDNFGGIGITAIDALDSMAVLGFHDDFRERALWACETLPDFATFDVEVSVFETVIRGVGGLLGAHFAYEHGLVTVDPGVHDYDGCLLARAAELADRLLPAFDTKTGIPFGTINLKRGVKKGEVQATSTACAGTLLLEFTVLSAVTGDPAYERAARKSAVELFKHRHVRTSTVGSHINITTGEWTMPEVLLGVSVDSYLEYLLKAFVLTGDELYEGMFETLRVGFRDNVMRGPSYGIEVKHDGTSLRPLHNSLANFYSTLLTMSGQLVEADAMVRFQHALFSRFGALPEGFELFQSNPVPGQTSAPLRPEHAESLYYLYRATGDGRYVEMAFEYATALEAQHRVKCGYASIKDVSVSYTVAALGKGGDPDAVARARFDDRMDSYFLAETLKYLFLTFDEHNALHGAAAFYASTRDRDGIVERVRALNEWAGGGSAADGSAEGTCGGAGPTVDEVRARVAEDAANFEDAMRSAQAAKMKPGPAASASGGASGGALPWLFNTEGHLLPVTPEWSAYSRHARRRDDDRYPLGPARRAPVGFPALDKLPFV